MVQQEGTSSQEGSAEGSTDGGSSPPRPESTGTSTQNSTNPANASDGSSIQKSRKRRPFIDSISLFRGVETGTVARVVLIILTLAGTIAAWVLAATKLAGNLSSASSATDNGSSVSLSGAGTVFIHVAFGMAVLAELVFLERTVYNFRGQRWNYLHPGEILPRHRRRLGGSTSANVAFAPWNRAPIPTYAAAIAENGVGTGDVEDNAIAVPPPPAYGHTRGSQLLLSGFLRTSLRQQIAHNPYRDSQASQTSDRPLSYASHDSDWDARCDAVRAITLQETLTRLERGPTPLPPPPNDPQESEPQPPQ